MVFIPRDQMFYWRLYPFVRVSLAFIAGIIIADHFPSGDIRISIFLSIACLLTWVVFEIFSSKIIYRGYIASWSIIIFFALMGFVRYSYNSPENRSDYFIKTDRDTLFLIGVVQEIPKLQKRAKTFVEIQYASKDYKNDLTPLSGKLLCYFDADDSIALSYKPGDKVIMHGIVKRVEITKNPKTFDYQSYLKYRKVLHQIHVLPSNHRLLSRGEMFFFVRYAIQAREYFLRVFENRIRDKDLLTIASALVLGFRNQLDPDLYQAFSDTGAVHVLAVSGLHVGIVCAVLIFFLDRIKSKRKWIKIFKAITLILLVWFFAFMTGAAPAVTRAAAMFSLFLIGRYWFDYVNIYNILGFCALFMLIFDPYLLFQASFQFSFLALTSLVFFQPYISSIFNFSNPLLQYSWNLISVSFAAQVLVFPITIYFFHKFPSYFMLSGLVAVPLAMICLVMGLAVLLSEPIIPLLNDILAPVYETMLEIFTGSILAIRAIPYSSINGLWLTKWELILIYTMLLLFMIALQLKRVKLFYYVATAGLILSCSVSYRNLLETRQLSMTVFDVYKGSLLDVYDGRELFTLKSDEISRADLQFVAHHQRDFKNVSTIFEQAFDDSFQGLRTKKVGEILAIKDRRIYMPKGELHEQVNADFVMLLDGVKLKPPSVNIFKNLPKMIIADRSVPLYVVNLWREYADHYGIGFHDVRAMGAWSYEIK